MPQAAAAALRKKRRKALAKHKAKEALREQKEKNKVNAWFAEFDTDKSGVLNREQLANLFTKEIGKAPPEDGLTKVMEYAVGVDVNGDGKIDTTGIAKDKAVEVVVNFSAR